MTALNQLATHILQSKYYAPDESKPEDVFLRVARVCSIPDVIDKLIINNALPVDYQKHFHPWENVAERVFLRRGLTVDVNAQFPFVDVSKEWSDAARVYYDAMCDLSFMPATPTLMNAGLGGMLSSCFAIRVPDTMEGIFDVVKHVAIISQKGGGCGLELSDLRPEGSPVGNRGGVSSGPISFLKVFNETGNQVKQGGARRAALLAGLRVDHPDILKFITCKEKEGELSNFNLSVFVTDEFLLAVEVDKNITLSHPKAKESKTIRAKEIWDVLIGHSHRNGEPGIIFQDRLDKDDVVHGKYGKLLVNPCSELPLHNYSSCNLASINLATCIMQDPVRLDTEKLCVLTRLGIRFLDNVIDINNYPLPEIERMTLKMRPIGLGTMGLHDLMLKLGTEYGSKHSLELIDDIFGLIKSTASLTSEHLGSVRGIPADLKENSIERRNGFLLTAPPTGTISMICNQVSSGIEPVFQWEYTRNDSFGTHKMRHFMLEKFGDDLPPYAKTALEISPEAHVAVQGRIQKYLDESVSKTVNLPHSATVEEVSNIFRLAYRTGCKSITVYRSGSRQSEVLVKEQKEIQEEVEQISKELTTARPATRDRPRVLFGATFKINTPGGKAYITVNEDPYGIRETFIHISKAGSEIATHVEAEGRLISHSLKHGIPVETLIGHLAGHKSNPIFDNGRSVKSVPDAVAYVLQQFKDNYEGFSEFLERDETYEDRPKRSKQTIPPEISGELCPECGEVLYQASGCTECASCGYSKCG